MEFWQWSALANGVVSLAYFAIFVAIISPLLKSGQLRTNKLGAATALIFISCSVGHAAHATHALELGLHQPDMITGRLFDWHVVMVNAFTAAIGAYYWTLRKTYGPLMHGAKLFEDMKERHRQALEINDNVVQSLTVAKLALEMGERAQATEALETSLGSARQIITDLLGEEGHGSPADPGAFRRESAATVPAAP